MYIIEKLRVVLCHFFAMVVDGLQINEPFNFDIIKIDTKTLLIYQHTYSFKEVLPTALKITLNIYEKYSSAHKKL